MTKKKKKKKSNRGFRKFSKNHVAKGQVEIHQLVHAWWLTAVILATLEAEIGKIKV
jgi:hypothetical protein